MPTSKKRKKRNPSRPRTARPTVLSLPADHDADFEDDAPIVVRQGRVADPTTVFPGPGNRIGVHDADAGVLHLPNAPLFDTRLGAYASGTYPLLLMAGPEFPGTWDDLVADILEFPRHPDSSEAEQVAALEELREHGYLVPYTDTVGDTGWKLAVPDDAGDHAFDWRQAAEAAATTESAAALIGPGPTTEHVERVHTLLTARGWSVEDFGRAEQPPADGPAQPDPDDGWTYRPSYGGTVINHIDDVTPRRLECRFRIGGWEDPTDPSGLLIVTAGNWEGCDEHDLVEHRFPLGRGDRIDLDAVAELLDDLEVQAEMRNPRDLIECRFFGPCGRPEGAC